MVEVFKTNIQKDEEAKKALCKLHQLFDFYQCNFDLEDCDSILRIKYEQGLVKVKQIIEALKKEGFEAEVLMEMTKS